MHTTADFTRRSSVYKKTHVEQYMSHKEIVYTDSGSPSFRQRFYMLSLIFRIISTCRGEKNRIM